MRRILIMAIAVVSAFLVASAIPDRDIALTSSPVPTLEDIVDASSGRIPAFCVRAVNEALPARAVGTAYERANARHYQEQQCIAGIIGNDIPR